MARQENPEAAPPDEDRSNAKRHLSFGWWSLLVFLTLGVVLEGLHGFKVGLYLDVSKETRRLMWTLAHAHGTLISLINIAFGLMLRLSGDADIGLAAASRFLLAANVLLPAGFFLGGLFIHAGDPGLGILLVPLGAVALFLGVLLAARGVSGLGSATPEQATSKRRRSKR